MLRFFNFFLLEARRLSPGSIGRRSRPGQNQMASVRVGQRRVRLRLSAQNRHLRPEGLQTRAYYCNHVQS